MREIRKLRCFFSIEAMTVILISLLVVIPLGMWMQHYTSTFYRITKDDSMEQDIRYLLTDIHHSWMMFSYEPSYVRPTGDVTESIISFKKNNGDFIRFYRKGDQVGKDTNYGKFENITQRIISSFQVTRIETEALLRFSILVRDLNGKNYTKMLTYEKNK